MDVKLQTGPPKHGSRRHDTQAAAGHDRIIALLIDTMELGVISENDRQSGDDGFYKSSSHKGNDTNDSCFRSVHEPGHQAFCPLAAVSSKLRSLTASLWTNS